MQGFEMHIGNPLTLGHLMWILRFHTVLAFLHHYDHLLDKLTGYPDGPVQEAPERFSADAAVLSV